MTPNRRAAAMLATIITSSMGFIDGTVVHIALPAMQLDFAAGFDALQWIANAYLLALCAVLIIGGALGDRYGSRRVLVAGLCCFTMASAACAASATSTQLIFARAVQGFGAALMLPQSLSIIARLYPPAQRGRAIGIWSAAASASAAAGPVVGGFLIDYAGWPYAFWVNLPLGILALLLTLYAVPRSKHKRNVQLDWQGSLLLAAGLGASVFATINLSLHVVGSFYVWPGWVVGALLIVLFSLWERRAPAPVLPAHFFNNKEFVLLNVYCLSVFATFACLLFLMPYVLITSIGLTASSAALNMLPLGVCISVLAKPVGSWADRVGYRKPMIYGALGIALVAALAGVVVVVRTPWVGGVVMMLFGLAAGLMVGPLTTGVLNSVDTSESGLASGINHAVTRVGSLLSIAAFGVLLALRYRTHLDHYLSNKLSAQVAQEHDQYLVRALLNDSANVLVRTDVTALPLHLQKVANAAINASLDRAFIEVMMCASALALIAAWCAVIGLREKMPVKRSEIQPDKQPESQSELA